MRFKKIFFLSIIPTLLVSLFLALGFIAGRYSITKNFDHQIDEWSRPYTLGNLLTDEQKKSLASVYYNEQEALKGMDSFSWAVPNIPTPFVGNAPMPGQHGNAHINANQFRSTKKISQPKPLETFRIFLTGGSTAYGSGAPSDETTIAGYLEKMLAEKSTPITKKKYEVFTMANPSWATTHERIVIENKLSEMEPDLIISLSGNNDVHWGLLGRNTLWFRSLADDYFLNLIKEVYAHSGQPDIPEVTRVKNKRIPPRLVSQRLLKNVRLITIALAQENVDYVFMLQPNLQVTEKQRTKREEEATHPHSQEYFRECYALIDKGLKGLDFDNYAFFNLSSIFDDFGNQVDVFTDMYHFGDRGNEIIAKSIYSNIGAMLSQSE
jgi:hypothetical protein